MGSCVEEEARRCGDGKKLRQRRPDVGEESSERHIHTERALAILSVTTINKLASKAMAAAGTELGWHGYCLLLALLAVCEVMAQQVCSRCPGDLRNGSEVASFCHSNPKLELKGRCCLRKQDGSEVIAGLDLWNCSLTHMDTELQNASTVVVLDLSENPLQNVSDSFFQGFVYLQYLALPLTLDCPGGNVSWENISVDTSERICSQQKDSCNNTAQLRLFPHDHVFWDSELCDSHMLSTALVHPALESKELLTPLFQVTECKGILGTSLHSPT
uniref:All-trans retinoic acid-induced differentiation factor isoform X2 n=1 Tax=Geotrypetes seraphini TaxID=260995 RepID=A0A6P8QEQ5_GEOSA|nr:all-trans retinoic acid-induced differentiation factor isoform X2 [Geotrypetes seraphini]